MNFCQTCCRHRILNKERIYKNSFNIWIFFVPFLTNYSVSEFFKSSHFTESQLLGKGVVCILCQNKVLPFVFWHFQPSYSHKISHHIINLSVIVVAPNELSCDDKCSWLYRYQGCTRNTQTQHLKERAIITYLFEVRLSFLWIQTPCWSVSLFLSLSTKSLIFQITSSAPPS